MIKTIKHEVVQVKSIKEFAHADGYKKGERILLMPYWIQLPDAWCFEFIRKDTDIKLLQHNIDKGAIYRLDKITSL